MVAKVDEASDLSFIAVARSSATAETHHVAVTEDRSVNTWQQAVVGRHVHELGKHYQVQHPVSNIVL